MINQLIKNRRQITIAVIAFSYTAIGLYLRILWRINHDLWQDEKAQLSWLGDNLWQTICQTRFNLQFPGDYVLIYPFYKLFGANKWLLATPHIIITLIGFYLFYRICQKYFKTILAYLIAFVLFANNYNLINHSFEIRAYSVLITLGLAGFLIIKYIFEDKNPPLIKKILISIFIFVGSFFQITAGYLLFFIYFFHLLVSRENESIGRALLRHLKQYGIGLAVTLGALYQFVSSSEGIVTAKSTYPFAFEFIPKGLIPILKGIFGNITGPERFYPLLSGIIIAFFIPHRDWLKQQLFFILLIILPIGGVLLGAVVFNYWFIQRLFIWAIPLFAFFLAWVWDSIIIFLVEKIKKHKARLLPAS